MDLESYKNTYEEGDAPGWKAIDQILAQLYPNREPDAYFRPILPAVAGGGEPLDGISLYRSFSGDSDHLHYISYGFSELYYNEEGFGQEFSKFGFELTFRLKPFKDDAEFPGWPSSLMQNLAKYVFQTGNYFDDYHSIPTNSPIRLESDTELRAIVFVTDSQLGEIDTVHGKVKFLQMVGITQREFDLIKDGKLDRLELVEKLKENNPLLITDLERKSIV
jgi:hypothetical protein